MEKSEKTIICVITLNSVSSPTGALPLFVKPLTEVINLHDVTEALLTEDIFEEDQVFFMVSIWMKLRGEQGQSLMQPYGAENKMMMENYKKKKHVYEGPESQQPA